jgi:hypothetical protein
MSEIEQWVTKSGLLAWHKYEAGVSTNGLCNDYSGNGRHLVRARDPPTLTADVLNGQHGWHFDATKNPLMYTGATVTSKHVFILASYDDATFNEFRSLLAGASGTSSQYLLLGDSGTDHFVDPGIGANFTYRKSDILYADNNAKAPMDGAFALIEVQMPSGYDLSDIQVGNADGLSNHAWKGYFVEQMIYSRVLSDNERHDIYEYIAMKFLLWKQNSAGLNVFPFQPNWGQPLSHSKRVLSSSAVSGAYKARSKSTQKKSIQPQFESRIAEEYDTAVAFNDEHYPGSTFIWKDDGFSPARETEMRFLSDVQMTRSEDFNDKDYNFQAVEV